MKHSRKGHLFLGGLLALTLASFIFISGPASAQNPALAQNFEPNKAISYDATKVPLATMKHWRDSNEAERYSFLIGFVTMLEIEKEWQGRNKTALPFKQSLVPSWTAGFAGKSLKTLHDDLNNYVAANPKDLNTPVVKALWFTAVQPTLDATDKKAKK